MEERGTHMKGSRTSPAPLPLPCNKNESLYFEHSQSSVGANGKIGGRGRFGRSGPVSEALARGIRTQNPLPKGSLQGIALGE